MTKYNLCRISLALAITFAVAPGLRADDKNKDKNRSAAPANSRPAYPSTYTQPAARPGAGSSSSYNNPNASRTNPRESNNNSENQRSSTTENNRNSERNAGKSEDGNRFNSRNDNSERNGNVGKQGAGHNGTTETFSNGAHKELPAQRQPTLTTRKSNDGSIQHVTASGRVAQITHVQPDGSQRTQHISPTGRVQSEVVKRPDGTHQTTQFDARNHPRTQTVTDQNGKKVEETHTTYGRDSSTPRSTETVKYDPASGKPVSKTVVIQQNNITINNTTVINNHTTINRNYAVGRYGYVYRPVVFVRSPSVIWYDPFWYGPSGVVNAHPFHYTWGWERVGWYTYHPHYFGVYEVYPAPSYWVTDYMIADYVADQYAAEQTAEQAREDARLAREDAEKARAAAREATEEAEIAEAKAAQAAAERRAAAAEAKLANADKCQHNGTPIDTETKEQLRVQVEATITEKKQAAESGEKEVATADVAKVLADAKHVYPVSKPFKVEQGSVTEGDLLRLEPGQDDALKNLSENTVVKMRVITCKGEEGEVLAGTVVEVPLSTVQEFDNEFRAKVDSSLAAADANKDQFKKGS